MNAHSPSMPHDARPSPGRKPWIDWLRAMAAFAVVVIHVTAPLYAQIATLHRTDWWIANIANCAVRFAVPLFVMLAGALLLGRNEDAAAFYAKRAARLLPAFIFWSVFYLLFAWATGGDGLDLRERFVNAVLVTGATYYHLWYLPMFFGLMLVHPFLNAWLVGRRPDRADLVAFFAVVAFFAALHQAAELIEAVKGLRLEWAGAFAWFVGCYAAGYVLEARLYRRLPNLLLIGVFLAVAAAGALGNFALVMAMGLVQRQFVLPDSGLAVLAMTAALFCLFRQNAARLPQSRFVAAAAEASFGIYLIHPVFLYVLDHALPLPQRGAAWYIPLAALGVFLASLGTIASLRRVPLFRAVC
ncbi:MAG TPA: acyltransferase family protein [Solidesulfovibrio magneticus]|nr:acyltransferase family protein [Solidesulfovibrio magneticus]